MVAKTLRVVYRGPGVDDGTLDVVAFGTSLIGLAELVHDAGKHLNPAAKPLTVRIKPGFKPGSFKLEIVLQVFEALLPVIAGVDPAEALSILLFGASAAVDRGREAVVGVLELLKKLGGKPPKRVTVTGDDNVIVEVEGDGNSVTVNRPVLDLALNVFVQRDAQRFVSILDEGNVEEVVVEDEDDRVRGAIDWKDRPKIDAFVTGGDEDILTERAEVWVYPTRPAFRDEYTWWFEWRGQKLVAEMRDEDFKRRVHERSRGVHPGDAYLVDMLSEFPRPGSTGKRRPRHLILKVLKEVRAGRQREIGEEE